MKKLMSMILISSLLLTVGCSSSDNSEKKMEMLRNIR